MCLEIHGAVILNKLLQTCFGPHTVTVVLWCMPPLPEAMGQPVVRQMCRMKSGEVAPFAVHHSLGSGSINISHVLLICQHARESPAPLHSDDLLSFCILLHEVQLLRKSLYLSSYRGVMWSTSIFLLHTKDSQMT